MSSEKHVNKSRLDFQRTETELFINYYLGQECLWNLQHVNYAKREHRTAALAMIAKQMACHGREMTVEQVTTKIASLRTYYGRELRKIYSSEKSGAGVEAVYQSTWEFFPLLDPFLRGHVQQRQSSSNMVKEDSAMCDVRPGLMEPGDGPDGQILEEASQQASRCEKPATCSAPPPMITKKRKVSDSTGDMANLLMRSLQSMEEKNKTKSERLNDSDYLFGHQVGLDVKKVQNERKKQQLKLKIQRLIFDFTFENEQ